MGRLNAGGRTHLFSRPYRAPLMDAAASPALKRRAIFGSSLPGRGTVPPARLDLRVKVRPHARFRSPKGVCQ